MPHVPVCVWAVLLTAVLQLSGFAHGYAFQTEVLYDVTGGLNFLSLIVLGVWHGGIDAWMSDPLKLAATALFVCSRGWLFSYLAWRAHERGGDSRFDGVKEKLRTFLVYWIVQGVWVLCISSPVLFMTTSPSKEAPLTRHERVLLAGFALGILCELVADVQKARWVRAGRQGSFCAVGLWSFSRHPNYFGEILQWWCAWLLTWSYASDVFDPLAWSTAVCPIFTVHILLNSPATGVMQANGKNLRKFYERCPEAYARYRASTSILIPMVGYRHVPLWLKRTLFLDLERYVREPQPVARQTASPDGLARPPRPTTSPNRLACAADVRRTCHPARECTGVQTTRLGCRWTVTGNEHEHQGSHASHHEGRLNRRRTS